MASSVTKNILPVLHLKQYLKFLRSGKGFDEVMKKVEIVSVADGKCTAEFTVQPEHSNPYEVLHGGFSATLVDIVSGIALLSSKHKGGIVSVNINMSFFKEAKVGENVTVEARTVKTDEKLAFLEIEIKNKNTGDLLITATQTNFIG